MNGMKIRLLHSGAGDWVGLYVDNNLIIEGHSLDEEEVIKAIVPDANFKTIWHNDEYLEEYGNRCPDNWPEDLG